MTKTGPGPEHLRALLTLNRMRGRTLYAGTVDPMTVADRRRRNKAARASRRANRRSK